MSILEEAKRVSLQCEVIKAIAERTKKYYQHPSLMTLKPYEILYINTLICKGISNYDLAETYLYMGNRNKATRNKSIYYHKVVGAPDHVLMRHRRIDIKAKLPHKCDYYCNHYGKDIDEGYQSRHMISQYKP